MGRNYNAEILTICICVQIKVRTICCEGRPSYPPLTSVTRHKFYGGFNSFRDDCYRFWSPQHPKHEQLHGATRKQINFQAPVLALLVSFLQLHENTNPTSPGTLMTCLSCWVSVQLCSSSSQTGPRQRQVSFKQKCGSWTLCPRRNMRGIRHQNATWGRNLAFWPQLGATGTLTRGSSVLSTHFQYQDIYNVPQSVAMLCIVVSARRYESYPMVVANLSDWMCDGGLGDTGALGHWWWWLPQ